MKSRFMPLFAAVILLLSGCHTDSTPKPTPTPPETAEMRGIWVSFLDIDPLLKDADIPTAKARLDRVFTACADRGMNTVFFHVRAHSDAYYPSAIFPPAAAARALIADGFDPLGYAVEAAHRHGLKLHAWINPYRIGEDKASAVCTAVFQQDGNWYYNPAADTARAAVINGVREILAGYAVDGIHFDDYFYPAALGDKPQPFEAVPDGITVGDWRRIQVDSLVSAVYGLAHAYGRQFGISPTALPQTDRKKAYADTAMWLASPGYVDYLCPQIYFGFTHETHPFSQTLAVWTALPRHNEVALFIGLALYKSGEADPLAGSGQDEWHTHSDIVARQVAAIRADSRADGFVLFRYAHLLSAVNETDNLQKML